MINIKEEMEAMDAEIISELATSDENGTTAERAFTDKVISNLCSIDDSILRGDSSCICSYENAQTNSKISAYFLDAYGEGDEAFGTIYAYISHYEHRTEPYDMRKDDVLYQLDNLHRFMMEATENPAALMDKLGEEDPLYQLVYELYANKSMYTKIYYVLLTNATIGSFKLKNYKFNGKDVDILVYDMTRYCNETAGLLQRDIIVDEELLGRSLPCIATDITIPNAGKYKSYLCSFNGNEIYKIFDKYQFRLLQTNVRSYLQLRGKTNRGIADTLKKEPHFFMAYNNGLSAVAKNVELNWKGNITSIDDFQVVNGGQTTASIYYAKEKNKCCLDDVWVTVKLTVIENNDDEIAKREIIKNISRYANTQNTIKFSDLSAMNAYNQEIYRLSQVVLTPKHGGNSIDKQTHWYFENLNGTYANECYKGGKKFKDNFPSTQKFNKTDMATYELSYQGFAAEACKGAQDAYKMFVDNLDKREKPTEKDFKNLVAKKIIFDTTYDIVSDAIGGQGKKHMAKYCIAYLCTVATKMELDLERIWMLQDLPTDMKVDIYSLVRAICPVLISAAQKAQKSVEMYCRQAGTWDVIKAMHFPVKHIASYVTGENKIIDILIPGYVTREIVSTVQSCTKEIFSDMFKQIEKYDEERFIPFDKNKLAVYAQSGVNNEKFEIAYAAKILYRFYLHGYPYDDNLSDMFRNNEDAFERLKRVSMKWLKNNN